MSGRDRKVTMITGASSGIGKATARLLGRRGDSLVLVARRKERLEELAVELTAMGVETLVVAMDLGSAHQLGELVNQVLQRFGRIDILINNAGFGWQELFEKMRPEDIEKMFQVNVMTPIELCRQVIPIMHRQNGGTIVNVSSVAGFVSSPMNSIYCATKHALVGFSKSLRQELTGTGIRVTVVCPGNTKTEFWEVAAQAYDFPWYLTKFAAPVSKIAQAIAEATTGRDQVVVPTLQAKAMYYTEKFFPFLFTYGGTKYRGMIEKK